MDHHLEMIGGVHHEMTEEVGPLRVVEVVQGGEEAGEAPHQVMADGEMGEAGTREVLPNLPLTRNPKRCRSLKSQNQR